MDPATKAELLNDQFSSVFTIEDSSPLPDLGKSPFPDAPEIQVTPNGVLMLMQGLNRHKATGPDSISSQFLREMMAHPLAPTLALVFQASLDQGQIPDDWRTAHVTPIFKKGDNSKASNYRPVSLTSSTCNLLKHIIHNNITNFVEKHKIISDYHEHGLKKHRSCETQLLTVNDLTTCLDNSQQIDAILLDVLKRSTKYLRDAYF